MADRRSTWQVEADLAAQAKAGNLTWLRESFRLWSSETEYRTLTAKERRILLAMIDSGRARREMAAGYRYVRKGAVTCT